MKRTILAATAAALLASATFGIAAPDNQPGPDRPRAERMSPEQMAENAGAMIDARIAALKAGLRLSADQEKLWPALETALRANAEERLEKRQEWREKRAERREQGEQRGPGERDTVVGLQKRAEMLLERGAALKSLADAAAPLYATLDDAQKSRFDRLFRDAQGPRMAWGHHHGPKHMDGKRHGGGDREWHRKGHDRDDRGERRGGADEPSQQEPVPGGERL